MTSLALIPRVAVAGEVGPPAALMRQCKGLFIDHDTEFGSLKGEVIDYRAWQSAFFKNLMGEDRADDLSLKANHPSTFRSQRQSDGSELFVYGKPMENIYASLRNPESPLIMASNMAMAPRVDVTNFYEAVYANYADAFRSDLIGMLHNIDDSLNPARTMHVRIRKTAATERENLEAKPAPENIYGTVRIYDGSMNPFGTQFFHEPLSHGSSLPLELINQARGREALKVQPLLDQYRAQGTKLFELGKLSINGPNGSFRRRTRDLIELFWLQWIANPYPDAVVFAHVVTEAHMRLYVKQYGFEVAEHIDVEGSPGGEWILWVPGWKFSEALSQRLKIPVTVSPTHLHERWHLPQLRTSVSAG